VLGFSSISSRIAKAGVFVVRGLPMSSCDADGIKFPVSRIRRLRLLKFFLFGVLSKGMSFPILDAAKQFTWPQP
jgi:hypothetical protein